MTIAYTTPYTPTKPINSDNPPNLANHPNFRPPQGGTAAVATQSSPAQIANKYGVFARPELVNIFLLDKVLENQKKIMEKLGLDVTA